MSTRRIFLCRHIPSSHVWCAFVQDSCVSDMLRQEICYSLLLIFGANIWNTNMRNKVNSRRMIVWREMCGGLTVAAVCVFVMLTRPALEVIVSTNTMLGVCNFVEWHMQNMRFLHTHSWFGSHWLYRWLWSNGRLVGRLQKQKYAAKTGNHLLCQIR